MADNRHGLAGDDMMRSVLAAGAVLLVLGAGGCTKDEFSGESSTTTSADTSAPSITLPEGAPEPSEDAAGGVLEFLRGEGAPLLVVHEAALSLSTDAPGSDACAEVADELDGEAPSGEIAALVTGVDDEVMRSALHSERVALGTFLTSCVDGERPAHDELQQAVGSVATRLQQLEDAG
jgi:hypothetical protein